jgi:hypothetical protein
MALDYLLIPGMSVEPERLFSSAKLIVDDLWSCLGGDTIEALECLCLWLKIKDTEIESLI